MKVSLKIITEYLKRKHCLAAMAKIDKEGVPKGREPEDYYIKHPNKLGVNKPYPVKLVVEYAFNMAAIELNSNLRITSEDFSSNERLRDFLRDEMKFNIEKMNVK